MSKNAVYSRPAIRFTTTTLTAADRWDNLKARLGISRSAQRVEPDLYALGNPGPTSPVFVSANYKPSFNALRSSLEGSDGFILVLDTKGINVWCAAGKGTFGTEELVARIRQTHLADVVRHRRLILPQLGAPGVAAHEVKAESGFQVEYGPVRARDLPAYLTTRKATAEMRRVRFDLLDRIIVSVVDIVKLAPLLIAALVVALLTGSLVSLTVAAAVVSGLILFPILLPWIPTPNFSTKGFLLGGLAAAPFMLARLTGQPDLALWQQLLSAGADLLLVLSATAFLGLNFTGSTTFTSRSGVKREIYAYFPLMVCMFATSILIHIGVKVVCIFGS